MNVYVPGAVKLLIVVVGSESSAIVADPGPLTVHAPLPVAAIVIDPPGRAIQSRS